jgi:4-amino-4-deoxy-L-arabinose transferase-like glycosyltransferase
MITSRPKIEEHLDSRTAPISALIDPRAVLGLAGLFWVLKVIYFWRYCRRNINADAISYIGIAHNITNGSFRASLHGYWSPLISWAMAATSFLSSDRTLAARLLMLPLFVACLILLHRLTDNLWHSKLLSAVAVLWFVAARGIAVFSVSFIGADLLLTALFLVYFNQLLLCLEQPEIATRWFWLGAAHGMAFLTKSVAMPLFAFTTALAVLWTLKGNWRGSLKKLLFAAAIPIVVWAGWGTALRAKYGVFTAGYQLRWNLIPPDIRAAQARGPELLELHDGRAIYDQQMVSDIMPPGSPLWQVKVWRPGLLR